MFESCSSVAVSSTNALLHMIVAVLPLFSTAVSQRRYGETTLRRARFAPSASFSEKPVVLKMV